MTSALLFLFAAETVLYSLLWHNQPAQSSGRQCPRRLEHKPLCRWLGGEWWKPAANERMLGRMERQSP